MSLALRAGRIYLCVRTWSESVNHHHHFHVGADVQCKAIKNDGADAGRVVDFGLSRVGVLLVKDWSPIF